MKMRIFLSLIVLLPVSVGHCAELLTRDDVPLVRARLASASLVEANGIVKDLDRSGLPLSDLRRAVEPLLASSDLRFVGMGVGVLFSNGDRDAAGVLFDIIKDDSNSSVDRVRAISAVRALRNRPFSSDFLLLAKGENDPEMKVKLLNAAIDCGGVSFNQDFFAICEEALKTADKRLTLKIIDLLKRAGIAAMHKVTPFIDNDDEQIAIRAIETVADFGGSFAKNKIRPYAIRENDFRALPAAYAMIRLGETSYVRHIAKFLNDSDESKLIELIAYLSLQIGKGGEEEIIPYLRRLSDDDVSQSVKDEISNYFKSYGYHISSRRK